MALIQCPECGKRGVSNTANACPGCGFPIREHFEKEKEEQHKKTVNLQKKEYLEAHKSSDSNAVELTKPTMYDKTDHKQADQYGCLGCLTTLASFICAICMIICIILMLFSYHFFLSGIAGMFFFFLTIIIHDLGRKH